MPKTSEEEGKVKKGIGLKKIIVELNKKIRSIRGLATQPCPSNGKK